MSQPASPPAAAEFQAALAELEARAARLEAVVGHTLVAAARDAPGAAAAPAPALAARVRDQEKAFARAVRDSKWVAEALEKYQRHARLLGTSDFASSFSSSSSSLECQILPAEAKCELVLAAEQDLRTLLEELREIDRLAMFVNPREFQALETLVLLLADAEVAHAGQTAAASEVIDRASRLLTDYQRSIHLLSEFFLTWDKLLAEADDKITAAEQAVAVR